MQTENRFFDDIARLAGGALGTLTGVRDEIQAQVRQQLERVLAQMDVVSREEFEAVKAMAAKARSTQESLEARLAALETRLAEAERATRSGEPKASETKATDARPAPGRKSSEPS